MAGTKLADLRKDYTLNGLSKQDVLTNPFKQFEKWFLEAQSAEVIEPNAMVLSTLGEDGYPHGRVVLLKEVDSTGFLFYTNYNSHKGADLKIHPVASLTFWWSALERQVRVTGPVERVQDEESDAYFSIRPRGSQLGAWVSEQSEVIENRSFLTERLAHLEQRFQDQPIPRPPHWGGYRVTPIEIEFWQGRPSRLHDRIRYRLEKTEWKIERLSP
ncbi:pyridoxamine 5'-phosphate oxidase [Runella slithyformis]|uniref:Pyridoxine/pyridoxamine 5'-phosphate oxidase n=1 Tax=Runella slithyformis (strain ATCC 29530 / DSM 19594 / LMG 11500 / NCIMB 11436 / LSU 4) TaxID=761193 RepID=A0A7U4E7Z5_RUNSL|nr:pyridoxamine 5'-phosphate oxidase [Runella slithyformis]AEI50904.1 Pyridoxine/pyridoxamine 5'-phosphate oxidase [Runella slithyformis DSM 19594]